MSYLNWNSDAKIILTFGLRLPILFYSTHKDRVDTSVFKVRSGILQLFTRLMLETIRRNFFGGGEGSCTKGGLGRGNAAWGVRRAESPDAGEVSKKGVK